MINLNILSAHVKEQADALAEAARELLITSDEFRDASNKLVTLKYEKRFQAFQEGQLP